MVDRPHDPRKAYIDEYKGTVDRHRERAFDYEKVAIEFANNAIRALTYLNGGALVAIPTAIGLFGADLKQAKFSVLIAAAFFVAGLIAVVMGQACGFYTMARRAEAELYLQHAETIVLNVRHYPDDQTNQTNISGVGKANALANEKTGHSNWWRLCGMIMVWSSVALFVAGCVFGGLAVLT